MLLDFDARNRNRSLLRALEIPPESLNRSNMLQSHCCLSLTNPDRVISVYLDIYLKQFLGRRLCKIGPNTTFLLHSVFPPLLVSDVLVQ